MRYLYSTKELLTVLRSSGLEATPASPFRAILTVNYEEEKISLTEDQRLLCAFALTPERTLMMGRHSSVDGELYLLNIGPMWYLYTWLEGKDVHVFEAYFDRPRLIKLLNRNFCGQYRPDFGAYTHLDLRLTKGEYVAWNLIRVLHAFRARTKDSGINAPFLADDLKNGDLALYLRNYLDELGLPSLSAAIDRIMDEKHHAILENALRGLEEKGILTPDIVGANNESAYRLTRTAMERLDDGMLLDTVRYADRTDPGKIREILFCLRRDGVLALIPTADGVALRTFDEFPWGEIL